MNNNNNNNNNKLELLSFQKIKQYLTVDIPFATMFDMLVYEPPFC